MDEKKGKNILNIQNGFVFVHWISIVMFNVIHDSIEAVQTNVLCPCPGYHLTFRKKFLVIHEHHLFRWNVLAFAF